MARYGFEYMEIFSKKPCEVTLAEVCVTNGPEHGLDSVKYAAIVFLRFEVIRPSRFDQRLYTTQVFKKCRSPCHLKRYQLRQHRHLNCEVTWFINRTQDLTQVGIESLTSTGQVCRTCHFENEFKYRKKKKKPHLLLYGRIIITEPCKACETY